MDRRVARENAAGMSVNEHAAKTQGGMYLA